jgi:sulfide:quinone oxidoreductase
MDSTGAAHGPSHQILIIGGGAAGIGLAAALRRADRRLDIAVVEPAERHCYQPALTLVGAGCYPVERTLRPEAELMPRGVTWIRAAAIRIDARARRITLDNGGRIGYAALVLCPGLDLHWGAIDGLPETLGRNGVTSNYDPSLAPYTWECLRGLQRGRAVFTQPPMPIKCPGAPQKIAYLAADYLRRQGRRAHVEMDFCLAGDRLFSVPAFVEPLLAVARRHGIAPAYGTELVAVDGDARRARFRVTDADGSVREDERAFDLLHVVPPQRAPAFVRESALANDAGWAEVDPASLQHPRFPEVFALGDVAGTPNSKTAAAVRAQIPVVLENLLAQLRGTAPQAEYDGYGACPLTTARGRVILAEFAYGGELRPSFPLDPRRERRSYWHFKKDFLPWFYWNWLLAGRRSSTPARRSQPRSAEAR